MHPELDNVLQSLFTNRHSVFALINDILSRPRNEEDQRIKFLQEGIERDAADICVRLLTHNPTSPSVSAWALRVARSTLSEVEAMSTNGHSVSESLSNKFGTVYWKNHRPNLTIDMLSDDALLEIFGFCLVCDPTELPLEQTKKWRKLVHVCRRWRQIIFASPRRLDLRLTCSDKIPVRKNLKSWPVTIPLTLDYSSRLFHFNDSEEANVVTALKHVRRVHTVKIVGSSFLKKVVVVMQKSLPALTHLELGWYSDGNSIDDVLSLPEGFLNGSVPSLQYLSLRSFSFPEEPTFLLSACNLVTLKLENMSQCSSISPGAVVESLSIMTKLKTLSLSICEGIHESCFDQERRCPDLPTRIVHPSLTHFRYEGYSGYLESLVIQFDAPRLVTLIIQYFRPLPEVQLKTFQLSRFIGRTENLKFDQFTRVLTSFRYGEIYVELDCPQGEYPQASLAFRLPGKCILNFQVHVVKFLGQLDAMLSNVDRLRVNGKSNYFTTDGINITDWMPFFRLFSAVEVLCLSGRVATFVASALEGTSEEMVTQVLPALHLIWLDDEDDMCEQLLEVGSTDFRQFLKLRQRSGLPVIIVDTQEEFDEKLECHRSGRENIPFVPVF